MSDIGPAPAEGAALSYVYGADTRPLLGETVGANFARAVARWGDRPGLIVRQQGVRKLVTGHILKTGYFRDVKTGRTSCLFAYKKVKYKKAPARMTPESPVLKTNQVQSVITQVNLS